MSEDKKPCSDICMHPYALSEALSPSVTVDPWPILLLRGEVLSRQPTSDYVHHKKLSRCAFWVVLHASAAISSEGKLLI